MTAIHFYEKYPLKTLLSHYSIEFLALTPTPPLSPLKTRKLTASQKTGHNNPNCTLKNAWDNNVLVNSY